MKKEWLEKIHLLLEENETEDLQSALALVSFHFDNCECNDVEFEAILSGITNNVPIPYIIGYTLICGSRIIINKDVLNPGPETVTLIEMAIEYANNYPLNQVLDLCTGSGAVAISLAKKCNAAITATDISVNALAVARLNASENKVGIDFLQGDLFEPVRGMVFDIIITNPPYVKTGEINKLPGFVRNYAPITAINGGEDGLFFHRAILSGARNFISPGGSLFMECEDRQDVDVEELAIEFGWEVKKRFPNKHGNIRGFMFS